MVTAIGRPFGSLFRAIRLTTPAIDRIRHPEAPERWPRRVLGPAVGS